jgi:DNA polymerase-3 subunit epsilon/CBS domain-containing protein
MGDPPARSGIIVVSSAKKKMPGLPKPAPTIADILNDVGIPYCAGGVMAKNPGCRHSLEDWKKVVEDWINHPGPKEALASDIFFDAVPVSCELVIANDLMNFSYDVLRQGSRDGLS